MAIKRAPEKVTAIDAARNKRAAKMQTLRNLSVERVNKQDMGAMGTPLPETGALYRRAVDDDLLDPYSSIYTEKRLKVPPYPFANLYRIYEESDVLQACVDAMKKNVDGFGYQMQFLGDDVKEKEKAPNKAQLVRATSFFDNVNEEMSFTTLRQLVREDVEVLGNGAIEVIRSRDGKIQLLYYLPFRNIRIAALTGDPITTKVGLPRDGKLQQVEIQKYFRRYTQMRPDGTTLRWFKELGDPRTMDATTGDYVKDGETPKMVASELWHIKIPFGGLAYGMPRWVGALLSVMGRRQAEFVNYDLFENQGIPPMAICVSGGTLTDESLDELEVMIKGMKGVQNWNGLVILEALVEGVGLEDRGSAKLELKNLAEYRKEDAMFGKYMDSTEKVTRHRYRLPPLYVGAAETFTHATAKAAQTVAEEQVFIPERSMFDEAVARRIMPELGIDQWVFKSKGPRIVGGDMLTSALGTFSNVGAFTVNHAIERANEAFGLEMSKFDAPWANYPVPFVLEMIKNGAIQPQDMIEGMKFTPPPQPQDTLPKPKQPLMLPAPSKNKAIQKAMESELFSDEEKALYKLLLTMQAAVESGHQLDAVSLQ